MSKASKSAERLRDILRSDHVTQFYKTPWKLIVQQAEGTADKAGLVVLVNDSGSGVCKIVADALHTFFSAHAAHPLTQADIEVKYAFRPEDRSYHLVAGQLIS